MASTMRGRPRQFDREEAILSAARLFWRRGFAGTSTRDLSAALGMSTSSLYGAFGSKAGLFEEAVRTYAERYRTICREACGQGRVVAVVEQYLERSIEEFTQPADHHPGCLVSSAALADAPDTLDVSAHLRELQAGDEEMLRERFARARDDGELSPDVDPALLAAALQTLWQGLSARSQRGASRSELEAVAGLWLCGVLPRVGPRN